MDINTLNQNLDNSINQLKNSVDQSLELLSAGEIDKKQVYKLWENEVKDFVQYSVKRCQETGNPDLLKMITRALIFGR